MLQRRGDAVLRPRQTDQDEGFTLVELIVAVAILGIIGSAIVSSIFVGLQTRARTTSQLAASHDDQNLASYWAQDVDGANPQTPFAAGDAVGVSTSAGTYCGTTVTPVVVFSGKDFDAGSQVAVSTTAVWVYDSAAHTLARTTCRGSATPSTSVLARELTATPTLQADCAGTTAFALTAPVVALKVQESDGLVPVLCGRRRTTG
ncbi:MAG: PulJ/GspJ family protein [Actinomycetes bacterium]